jgi:hypothetical protein
MNLPAHQYYSATGEILEYPVEYLRELKINEVNEWRDKSLMEPVEYEGHLFDFDQASQFRVLAVVIAGQGSPTGFWTTADNKDVPSDAAFMLGLYTAMVTKFSVIHATQRKMKTDLETLNTAAALAAYGVPQ